MQGYIPLSDEFMLQDPEHIDEYREWQRFAKFLADDHKLNTINKANNTLNPPESRRRLKRYIIRR